jgi:hypothetical protein
MQMTQVSQILTVYIACKNVPLVSGCVVQRPGPGGQSVPFHTYCTTHTHTHTHKHIHTYTCTQSNLNSAILTVMSVSFVVQ